MIACDLDARQVKLRQLLWLLTADGSIRLTQNQHWRGRRSCAPIVEQPKQHQLGVRLRIDPQFDQFAFRTQLDQSQIGCAKIFEAPRRGIVLPMKAILLRRAGREELRVVLQTAGPPKRADLRSRSRDCRHARPRERPPWKSPPSRSGASCALPFKALSERDRNATSDRWSVWCHPTSGRSGCGG